MVDDPPWAVGADDGVSEQPNANADRLRCKVSVGAGMRAPWAVSKPGLWPHSSVELACRPKSRWECPPRDHLGGARKHLPNHRLAPQPIGIEPNAPEFRRERPKRYLRAKPKAWPVVCRLQHNRWARLNAALLTLRARTFPNSSLPDAGPIQPRSTD